MALNGSIEVQFEQIIRSFSRVITEVLGGEAKLPAYARANIIEHTCLKAILYVSKSTEISDGLVQRLQSTFAEIPLIVVRANTLPKNAPIELEMTAMGTKSQHEIVATSDRLTVRELETGRLLYHFSKFDSMEACLGS